MVSSRRGKLKKIESLVAKKNVLRPRRRRPWGVAPPPPPEEVGPVAKAAYRFDAELARREALFPEADPGPFDYFPKDLPSEVRKAFSDAGMREATQELLRALRDHPPSTKRPGKVKYL